uniref:Late embryogenesis abundant n=1 Tax=Cleistogenes songorica TaxID=121774 RepID=A0A2S1WLR9_9POAL|nr:late embryogenesis abundant [Cleistogenes songorica]
MAKLVDKAKGFVADKVAHVQKPEADLADLSVGHVGRDGATLAGRLDVRNPYSHSIPICEISYSLKSAGREVASGTVPDPGSLVASDTTRLDVPVKIPYDFLVSLVKDAGSDWDIDYEMRVGLTVDLPIIGNFTLPLTKTGELKLPTLSTIF